MIKKPKKSVFSAKNHLIKQIDCCTKKGPVPVAFSGIYTCKTEDDGVKLLKPIFCKRFIDDKFVKRNRNKIDLLFDVLPSYPPKIKISLTLKPKMLIKLKRKIRLKLQFLSKTLITQCIGPQKCHFDIRRMQFMVTCTEPRKMP